MPQDFLILHKKRLNLDIITLTILKNLMKLLLRTMLYYRIMYIELFILEGILVIAIERIIVSDQFLPIQNLRII